MTNSPLIGARLLGFGGENQAVDTQLSAGDNCPRLVFNDGYMEVFNPFRLGCDSGEAVSLGAIIGCTVSAAIHSDMEFSLVFEGRISLRISLREEDFIGAEAARYHADSGEIVIIQ